MAISIKKSSKPAQNPAPVSSLTPEVQTQISNNTKLDTTDYTELPAASITQAPAVTEAAPQVQTTVPAPAAAEKTVTPSVTQESAKETAEESLQEESKPAERNKRTEDLVQLKFSHGKRAEAKAFFASCDVKMNSGFEMAYEFLKEEVNAGRVKLSKSGIQRINKD